MYDSPLFFFLFQGCFTLNITFLTLFFYSNAQFVRCACLSQLFIDVSFLHQTESGVIY